MLKNGENYSWKQRSPLGIGTLILVDENTEIITLPVCFADQDQERMPSDLSNVTLEEAHQEYWHLQK